MGNNSNILCDDCGAVLAIRRRNQNVVIRATIERGKGSSLWAVCICGGRKELEGVQPILLSA